MRATSAAIASGDGEVPQDGGGAVLGSARRAAYASEIWAPSRQSPKSKARFMSAHARARVRVSVRAWGFVRCLEHF